MGLSIFERVTEISIDSTLYMLLMPSMIDCFVGLSSFVYKNNIFYYYYVIDVYFDWELIAHKNSMLVLLRHMMIGNSESWEVLFDQFYQFKAMLWTFIYIVKYTYIISITCVPFSVPSYPLNLLSIMVLIVCSYPLMSALMGYFLLQFTVYCLRRSVRSIYNCPS